MCNTTKLLLTVTGTFGLMLSSGCKTGAPAPSGFLSDYSRMRQVDNSTWRYVDASRLGSCQSFAVSPVTVRVSTYSGTSFGADQQQTIGTMFRQKIVSALSKQYEVIGTSEANAPDIRVAITQAYQVGNSLALGIEAEILDRQSHQQLAAIRGIRIGPPEAGFRMGYHNPDAGGLMAGWWTWPSANQLMQQWADQIRGLVDEAHRK
jgi:hypothetical protein